MPPRKIWLAPRAQINPYIFPLCRFLRQQCLNAVLCEKPLRLKTGEKTRTLEGKLAVCLIWLSGLWLNPNAGNVSRRLFSTTPLGTSDRVLVNKSQHESSIKEKCFLRSEGESKIDCIIKDVRLAICSEPFNASSEHATHRLNIYLICAVHYVSLPSKRRTLLASPLGSLWPDATSWNERSDICVQRSHVQTFSVKSHISCSPLIAQGGE